MSLPFLTVLVGVVEELAQPWRLPTFFPAPI